MNKNLIENLASLSRFALAGAVFYFVFQLYQINQNVPAISQSIDRVSRQVEPLLEEAQVRYVVQDDIRVQEIVRGDHILAKCPPAQVEEPVPFFSCSSSLDPFGRRPGWNSLTGGFWKLSQ